MHNITSTIKAGHKTYEFVRGSSIFPSTVSVLLVSSPPPRRCSRHGWCVTSWKVIKTPVFYIYCTISRFSSNRRKPKHCALSSKQSQSNQTGLVVHCGSFCNILRENIPKYCRNFICMPSWKAWLNKYTTWGCGFASQDLRHLKRNNMRNI